VARVLTDEDLRDRLITEASEHVLGFDWAEIAVQTEVLYSRLARRAGGPISRRSAAGPARARPGARA
jgi:hypothetical protein